MIKLKFNCEFTESSPPFAGKLSTCNQVGSETPILHDGEVKCFYDEIKRGYSGRSSKGGVFIPCGPEYDFDGFQIHNSPTSHKICILSDELCYIGKVQYILLNYHSS